MCETAKTENSNQNQYIKTVENIGILYEDPYILVCHKPAGIPVQSANARVKDMVSILKLYLQEQSGQPGEPYLGVVHRLDQPVQGVILFAKTKQAAANLSEQVAKRKDSGQVVKRYCAVVHRNPKVYKEGKKTAEYQELTDYLQRDRRTNTSYIVPKETKGAKESRLRFAVLKEVEDLSLLDIELLTGRHHQIRVQLSGAGMPIVGDKKYTSLEVTKREGKAKEMPALCAYSLSFCHPETGKQMDFTVKPEGGIFDKFRKNDQE
jgi:23S rRNA pseudouridine1911/1915/1917 synthase